MVKLRSYSEKIFYNVNVSKLISDIYYSDTREISREFVSLEVFEDSIFNQVTGIEHDVVEKMNLGFDFLCRESREDFVNMGYDDEDHITFNPSLSNLAHRLLSNLLAHFSCSLALLLLETTDVEDILDRNIRLSELSRYSVVFTLRN